MTQNFRNTLYCKENSKLNICKRQVLTCHSTEWKTFNQLMTSVVQPHSSSNSHRINNSEVLNSKGPTSKMCACRLGRCEINNNNVKPKKKTPSPLPKKKTKAPVESESSDWSDSDSDSCSGCSDCYVTTSTCTCSECNMETSSSDEDVRYRKAKAKKKSTTKKVLRCKDGVCEWVTKKKVAKPEASKKKKKKSADTKTGKKKAKPVRGCYDCR